jgi:uncharacterized membrane protein
MKSTLRALPLALSASLLCGAALAQVQPSPSGRVHSRFGLPLSRTQAQPTNLANRQSQSSKSPALSFTFGTIDYPNAPQTVAQAINKKGEIVGSWGPDINDYRQGLPAYGFSLKGSSFKKIVYPSAPITVPFGVNYSGEIVGYYSLDPKDNSGYGFTLMGNTFTSVAYPSAQYTELVAINKSGQILTLACFSGVYSCESYLLESGTFSAQILYPGSAGTIMYGINDAGEIVGTYSNDEVTFHGFTLTAGIFTTVDYPVATDTYLTGINNSGQIVGAWDSGEVDPYGNPLTHGFLLESGTFTSFDSPYAGVASTGPWGINDRGVIVGQTVDANDFFLGFEATIGK